MSELFNTAIYQPLYNGLIFLFDLLPWADAGVLVILFTIIVKLVLFPLSYKAAKTQVKMRLYEPDLARIRSEHKETQEQALKVMEFYKEKGINPFASFFLLLIQLPIIFALYFVFLRSGLPVVNESLLYPFINAPGAINMTFLGLIDTGGKSVILALLAGISSYFQMRLSSPSSPKKPADGKSSFKDDLASTMNSQMKYVFPLMAFIISYQISGVVALYWFTSNMFMIAQELYVRKKLAVPAKAAQ